MNVREKAVYYLNIKPRTKKQVIRYLKEKNYDMNEIMEAVNELEEYHYIDDKEYCRMYFELGFEKGLGVNRIRRELIERGISSELIEIVYEELEFIPDQVEIAMAIGRNVIMNIDISNLEYEEKQKLKAKIGRRIANRGFSADVAYKVMNELVK